MSSTLPDRRPPLCVRRRRRLALCALALAAAGCGRIGYEDVFLSPQPPSDARDRDADDASVLLDQAPPPDPGAGDAQFDREGGVEGDAGADQRPPPPPDAGPDAADRPVADTAPGDARDTAAPLDVPVADTMPTGDPCRNPSFPAGGLIADFEAGTATTVVVGDRGGTPFTVANSSVTADVALVQAQCANRRALFYRGGTTPAGTSRLLQARFIVQPSSGVSRFLDARRWRGISFSVRASVPRTFHMKVSDRNTSSSGGVCTACSDHFQIGLAAGTNWTAHDVPFSTLTQTGVGDSFPALDTSALLSLEFSANTSQAFELWLDDIAFLE
jgi:hypothetical protein